MTDPAQPSPAGGDPQTCSAPWTSSPLGTAGPCGPSAPGGPSMQGPSGAHPSFGSLAGRSPRTEPRRSERASVEAGDSWQAVCSLIAYADGSVVPAERDTEYVHGSDPERAWEASQDRGSGWTRTRRGVH